MDIGTQNGARTDHDRELMSNGINGQAVKMENIHDKGKAIADLPTDRLAAPNGAPGTGLGGGLPAQAAGGHTPNSRGMDALPDEIQHITEDIMPLGLLLTRLAQVSHNQLQDTITSLAAKQVPQQLANGNSDYRSTSLEDTSPESLEKKSILLDFAQDLHTKWVKALIITDWSKKADLVGRLIDIRSHLLQVLESYNANLWDMISVKRDLHWAKVRGPDIQTALEVLSTGEANWMPDLGYIDPPPITLEEQEKWVDNLNTMLSVRLTLDEHDKIPLQFRKYSISSGRVTFRVKDEFEVDLTIADEDFEKQFWFIDFRFLFSPAPAELSERARQFIEAKVNDALATDGLAGCYKFLHEFVLTHQISEFYRQALALSRNKWVGQLKVERLHRAMSIQYWAGKSAANPRERIPGSWIILGVISGQRPGEPRDANATSALVLRWFRDGKEVQGFEIPLTVDKISAETLLKAVIARHVEHILSSINAKLKTKPRFATRQANLRLDLSKDEPTDSALTMQLVDKDDVVVRIAAITGFFDLSPQTTVMGGGVRKFDASLNPAEDGATILEQLRSVYLTQELNRRAKSTGWALSMPPIKPDELKQHVSTSPQERYQPVWLRRPAWNANWYVLVSLSLEGDRWWLVEVTPGNASNAAGNRVKMFTRLPLNSGPTSVSDEFFGSLTVFVAGIVTHITDVRELRRNQITYGTQDAPLQGAMPGIKLPVLSLRLSALLKGGPPNRRAWAKDCVTISFKGVYNFWDRQGSSPGQGQKAAPTTQLVAEARLTVADKSRFSLLKGSMGHDVQFNPRTGQFVMRLRADVGRSIVTLLTSRLEALQRLVYLVEAIRQGGKGVILQDVSLRQISFAYENGAPGSNPGAPSGLATARRWKANLDLTAGGQMGITLERGNPHLRVKDVLAKVVRQQLEQLPTWLLLTLPLFRSLDKIEDDWERYFVHQQGTVEFFPRDMQWIVIRYTLPSPQQQPRRRLNLDIRLRPRRGRLQWHVARMEQDPNAKNPNDEFNKILRQHVWSTSGTGWKGLMTGAAAEANDGVESLLLLIDTTIRGLLPTHKQIRSGTFGQ